MHSYQKSHAYAEHDTNFKKADAQNLLQMRLFFL